MWDLIGSLLLLIDFFWKALVWFWRAARRVSYTLTHVHRGPQRSARWSDWIGFLVVGLLLLAVTAWIFSMIAR